jgi:CRP-like cAMP-binding protein
MIKPRLSLMSQEIADLFRLNRRDARATQQIFTEIIVDAGTELALEGSHQHQLVLILDGEVEVTRDGKAVATLGRGDVLGEITALGAQTFQTATCTATCKTRIAVAGHKDLARIRECTGLYLHLQHLTSKRTVGVS